MWEGKPNELPPDSDSRPRGDEQQYIVRTFIDLLKVPN